jgi:hypothetical protein
VESYNPSRPVHTISEDIGPYCDPSSSGYHFDLHNLLVKADPMIRQYWYDSLKDPAAPSETSQNVRLKTIHTIIPFIFYVFGAVDCVVVMAVTPRTLIGRRHSNILSFSAAGVWSTMALSEEH